MDEIRQIDNEVILQGRRNNQAWFAPSLAVAPAQDGSDGMPEVHVSVIQLIANDFGPMHYTHTTDMGATWSPPMESLNLMGIVHADDCFEKPQLVVGYHRATRTVLGLGGTMFVRDADSDGQRKLESVVHERQGDLAYSVWDNDRKDFTPWRRLQRPGGDDLECSAFFYCSQWHERADGTMVVPVVTPEGNEPSKIAACEMFFDGATLTVGKIGSGLVGKDQMAGIHEPSLVEFGGRYYMTVRSEYGDGRMYHALSDNGLDWEKLSPWCWDDGTEIETENTQQHWLKRDGVLYLIYTRKSELSNGVLRHRAPLFIARVDTDTLQLIRDSERIVFPERRARMGNFNVANVTKNEAWIVTGEWLQQLIPGYQQGMRFWTGESPAYNRIQYIGDLLLARIRFA